MVLLRPTLWLSTSFIIASTNRLCSKSACVSAAFLRTSSASSSSSTFVHNTQNTFRTRAIVTRKMSSSSPVESSDDVKPPVKVPGRPTWQQTMLRIKDPQKSLDFYTNKLGFTHIDTFDFPQNKFSLYFLTTLKPGETYDLKPGTQAAHDYLWTIEGTALELTHNHGSENDDNLSYHPGNEEKDGFGHIAVNVDDVYATAEKLEKQGCSFKKKPDEGRMKGLAFVYDPDGYWIEIVKRADDNKIDCEYNFSQTMLRIKDPVKSLAFYKAMNMDVLSERHFDDFSLYFLGTHKEGSTEDVKKRFDPVLELTHNHGTEKQEDFKHYNGNEEDRKGFGHIGFLVDDVYKACDAIREMGYGFRKEPDEGSMKGLAFAYDPDGYSIEIIKRGGVDYGDERKE